MLTIRLFRVGKLNQPFFKIVVTEKKHASRAGRFVEEVGFYDPVTKEKNIKTDRIKYWLGVGAQASPTIHNLLISEKIIQGDKKKINISKSKKEKPAEAPAKPEEMKTAEKPAAETLIETKEDAKPAEPDKKDKEQPEDNSDLTPASKNI